MTDSVRVITGARVHFGLLPDDPRARRQFGGAGLMVDRPGFDLTVSRAKQFFCEGARTTRERIEKLIRLIVAQLPPGSIPHSVAVKVAGEIPAHVGLGSGTQLSLAMAHALAQLANAPAPDAISLGHRLGRGTRSLLGLYGFTQGGFLVDAGRTQDDAALEPTARIPFPDEWRLLLITPAGMRGLAGSAERSAFERLPRMNRTTGDRLRKILWDELLPAVREANFRHAGAALGRFGQGAGEAFATVQGGIYASPALGQLAERVRSLGVEGVGQSSWGPTLFALCENDTHAEDLHAHLQTESLFTGSQLTIAQPLNHGALMERHPSRL